MRRILCFLLVVLGLWINGTANAGIYNNSGTNNQDSICFVGYNLSADGKTCVAIATGSDSLYVLVLSPGGGELFRDSVRMDAANVSVYGFEDQAAASGFAYRSAVASVDGSGYNGTYKIMYFFRDVSEATTTPVITEAQVYQTADFSAVMDKANSLTFTVSNEVNANVRYYEGQDDVDAEIQSEAADALAAYDPPTNSEMEARTLVAASYFDPTADSVTVDMSNLYTLQLQDTVWTIAAHSPADSLKYQTIVGGLLMTIDTSVYDGTITTTSWEVRRCPGWVMNGTANNVYGSRGVLFLSGGARGNIRRISSNTPYDDTMTTMVVSAALGAAPVQGDTLLVLPGYLSVSVSSMGNGTITAATFGDDAITAAKVKSDVGAEFADATWDESASGHCTSPSMGYFNVTDSSEYVSVIGRDNFVIWKAVVDDTVAPTTTTFWAKIIWPTSGWGSTAMSYGDQHAMFASGSTASRWQIRRISSTSISASDSTMCYFDFFTPFGAAPAAGDTLLLLMQSGQGVTEKMAYGSITAQSIAENAFGASELASDAVTEIVDSILGKVLDRVYLATLPDSTIGAALRRIFDSVMTNQWWATGTGGGGGSCAGSGSLLDSLRVVDTSGTDALVVGAKVTVTTGGSQLWLSTNGAGWAVFNLEPSTTYVGQATTSGYIFPAFSFTTLSGTHDHDSICGYDIAPTLSSSTAQQTTLYDWAIVGVDTLKYAKVTITLGGALDFRTSSDLVPPISVTTYADSNGLWQKVIFGTDSLLTSGGGSAAYTIKVEHELLDQPAFYPGLTIPANGATTRLRDVLAAQ